MQWRTEDFANEAGEKEQTVAAPSINILLVCLSVSRIQMRRDDVSPFNRNGSKGNQQRIVYRFGLKLLKRKPIIGLY